LPEGLGSRTARKGTRSEGVEESRAQQGGLPAPRGADEGEEPAPDKVTDSLGHDLLPAAEELRVRGLESCQPLERAHVGGAPGLCAHRPAAFQPGVVGEDRRVEPLQLGARLDPELTDQYLAGAREDLQRLGLAAGSVQGHHQLAPPPLAERLLPDHGLKLGDQLTRTTGSEPRIDQILGRRAPELLEPLAFGRPEARVR
jgi:hypothetical protein